MKINDHFFHTMVSRKVEYELVKQHRDKLQCTRPPSRLKKKDMEKLLADLGGTTDISNEEHESILATIRQREREARARNAGKQKRTRGPRQRSTAQESTVPSSRAQPSSPARPSRAQPRQAQPSRNNGLPPPPTPEDGDEDDDDYEPPQPITRSKGAEPSKTRPSQTPKKKAGKATPKTLAGHTFNWYKQMADASLPPKQKSNEKTIDFNKDLPNPSTKPVKPKKSAPSTAQSRTSSPTSSTETEALKLVDKLKKQAVNRFKQSGGAASELQKLANIEEQGATPMVKQAAAKAMAYLSSSQLLKDVKSTDKPRKKKARLLDFLFDDDEDTAASSRPAQKSKKTAPAMQARPSTAPTAPPPRLSRAKKTPPGMSAAPTTPARPTSAPSQRTPIKERLRRQPKRTSFLSKSNESGPAGNSDEDFEKWLESQPDPAPPAKQPKTATKPSASTPITVRTRSKVNPKPKTKPKPAAKYQYVAPPKKKVSAYVKDYNKISKNQAATSTVAGRTRSTTGPVNRQRSKVYTLETLKRGNLSDEAKAKLKKQLAAERAKLRKLERESKPKGKK